MEDIEAIYLDQDAKYEFLSTFCSDIQLNECIILSTCNRFEVYFESQNPERVRDAIQAYIAKIKLIPPNKPSEVLHYLEGEDVMRHLFHVSAGIDSMVFGENEILTQVKESYDKSRDSGRTGAMFNKLFQTSVSVGKRVRSETEVSKGSYSVSSIAIEAIRENNLDYFGQSILIIGAGVIGKRCVKKLRALGHPDVTIVNRTTQKAADVAKDEDISYLPYVDLEKAIPTFSIIITAVSSSEPIIKTEHFKSAANKTQLIVDLGLPRNADSSIPEKTGIKVITVDGLREIAEKNVGRRKAEVEKVKGIIEDELRRFNHWESMRNAETHSSRNA